MCESAQRQNWLIKRESNSDDAIRRRVCVHPAAGAVQLQSVMRRVCEQHHLHMLQFLPVASSHSPGPLHHTTHVHTSLACRKQALLCVCVFCTNVLLCVAAAVV